MNLQETHLLANFSMMSQTHLIFIVLLLDLILPVHFYSHLLTYKGFVAIFL